MKIQRDMRHLLKQAQRRGWTLRPTSKGHIKLTAPSGQTTVVGGNESDHRALHNNIAKLRRMGLDI